MASCQGEVPSELIWAGMLDQNIPPAETMLRRSCAGQFLAGNGPTKRPQIQPGIPEAVPVSSRLIESTKISRAPSTLRASLCASIMYTFAVDGEGLMTYEVCHPACPHQAPSLEQVARRRSHCWAMDFVYTGVAHALLASVVEQPACKKTRKDVGSATPRAAGSAAPAKSGAPRVAGSAAPPPTRDRLPCRAPLEMDRRENERASVLGVRQQGGPSEQSKTAQLVWVSLRFV